MTEIVPAELDDLIARLEIAPTIHLPEVTMATATTLRQILVDRAEAATALRALKGERDDYMARAVQKGAAHEVATQLLDESESSLAAQKALVETERRRADEALAALSALEYRVNIDRLNRATDAEINAKLPGKETTPNPACNHDGWSFAKHGRCCFKCGVFMLDFGD